MNDNHQYICFTVLREKKIKITEVPFWVRFGVSVGIYFAGPTGSQLMRNSGAGRVRKRVRKEFSFIMKYAQSNLTSSIKLYLEFLWLIPQALQWLVPLLFGALAQVPTLSLNGALPLPSSTSPHQAQRFAVLSSMDSCGSLCLSPIHSFFSFY